MINFKVFLQFFLIFSLFLSPALADLEDFDLSRQTVDAKKLVSGGVSKDGIPALVNPNVLRTDQVEYLKGGDLVIGVVIDDQPRAYPIRILNWHEVVNDTIGDASIAVTYCPLTRSGLVFYRDMEGQTFEFGVSGLLYNSNLVLYDRKTNGLWSQLKRQALTGTMAGKYVRLLPFEETNWRTWKLKYPHTTVMSDQTGFDRDYQKDPYRLYHESDRILYPMDVTDDRLKPKDVVVGVMINGQTKAYPLKLLQKLKNKPLIDNSFKKAIIIEPQLGPSFIAKDNDGNVIPTIVAYWFAWSGFHPKTEVFQGK